MKMFLLAALFATAAFAQSPLNDAKTIFVLPMPGGLDQYLAVRLAQDSTLTVVTKADTADLLLTDQLTAAVEKKADETSSTFSRPTMRPLARGKGTFFLVDRQSGNVVWSTIEPPKSTIAKDLKTAATHIVDRLNKARAAKK